VSSPTLGVDGIEPLTPSVEVEVPRTPCIKGGPVIGMPMALAWLEPLDASPPALGIDGIVSQKWRSAPMLSLQVD